MTVVQKDSAFRRLQKTQHHACDGALPRAGLADEPQRLAAIELKRDIVHDAHGTEVLRQIVRFEQQLIVGLTGHYVLWLKMICHPAPVFSKSSMKVPSTSPPFFLGRLR